MRADDEWLCAETTMQLHILYAVRLLSKMSSVVCMVHHIEPVMMRVVLTLVQDFRETQHPGVAHVTPLTWRAHVLLRTWQLAQLIAACKYMHGVYTCTVYWYGGWLRLGLSSVLLR